MPFEYKISVTESDIDELGHVNNVVFVRYVQEAAEAHWNFLTSTEVRKQFVWVVLRHEIDYLLPAFPGDKLIAHTWVGETTGARSIRHVDIYHANSGKLLVKAKTHWCQLDATTFKPKRVDDTIIRLLTS